MKKNLILSITALVLLSGCAQKAPNLSGDVSDATGYGDESVNMNDGNGITSSPNGAMIDGRYNSSSDGFQSIYFSFGKYNVESDMYNYISKNANNIENIGSGAIKIEGNCDEFGTDEYNYALGLKRAKAVKEALVSKGIGEDKFILVSLGESSPVCSEPTEVCYSRNRRVDLRVAR
ncbi:MAG: OmpA family protein [Campylobacterales bacterium]|nr:OmpA family protein [Campylobacterales bacterium]